MKTLFNCEKDALNVFVKLFDAQVQPIVRIGLKYGVSRKVSRLNNCINLFAMKKFLNLDIRMPNELGRYPIYLKSYL